MEIKMKIIIESFGMDIMLGIKIVLKDIKMNMDSFNVHNKKRRNEYMNINTSCI